MYLVKHFQIKKELTPWVSGLLAASLLAGVGYTAYSQLTVKSSRETRRKEKTVAVERVNLPITISANGTIVPERSVNVSPKTSGMLKSLLVKEGDKVENIIPSTCSENEERNNELREHAADDCMPIDAAAIARCGIK